MVDFLPLIPTFDRILMIAWLCKDFGWMTTNIYLGFPFGLISVSMHFFLLLVDPRKAFRFYNVSLFFWVSANFIWMLLEFTSSIPSSHIHMGPKVPFGGVSDEAENSLIRTKTAMFFFAAAVQIFMYLGIYYNAIEMPGDEDEDTISKNEAHKLFFGKDHHSIPNDTLISKSDSGVDHHSHELSLAFIENAYIIFWISKDLFWSWGTGDLTHGKDSVIFYESTAMLFGTLSILIYLITAYVYRRNIVLLVDSVTTICWIGANYVWMCGEFFLRYNNLEYDDLTEHDDSSTRIISSVLFCLGITLQISNILFLTYRRYHDKISCSRRRPKSYSIQMFTINPIVPSTSNDRLHTKKSHNRLNMQDPDDSDEEIVLF